MNLYLLTQSDNTGYDTYDSCVVAAKNEKEAVRITPGSFGFDDPSYHIYGIWAKSPETVDCELIGKAVTGTKAGVICASYNAG